MTDMILRFVSITKIPDSSASMKFSITVKPIANAVERSELGDFDGKAWYRLKNTYNPLSYSLDVRNDNGINSTGNIQMAYDGNFSGQHWYVGTLLR